MLTRRFNEEMEVEVAAGTLEEEGEEEVEVAGVGAAEAVDGILVEEEEIATAEEEEVEEEDGM